MACAAAPGTTLFVSGEGNGRLGPSGRPFAVYGPGGAPRSGSSAQEQRWFAGRVCNSRANGLLPVCDDARHERTTENLLGFSGGLVLTTATRFLVTAWDYRPADVAVGIDFVPSSCSAWQSGSAPQTAASRSTARSTLLHRLANTICPTQLKDNRPARKEDLRLCITCQSPRYRDHQQPEAVTRGLQVGRLARVEPVA